MNGLIDENAYDENTIAERKKIKKERREKRSVWFNKNWKKITFALALTGAITGSIGLIVGSVGVHNTSGLSYYLKSDYTAIWGEGTIWQTKSVSSSFSLYFSKNKKDINDIKWNGKYPKGYFNDEK